MDIQHPLIRNNAVILFSTLRNVLNKIAPIKIQIPDICITDYLLPTKVRYANPRSKNVKKGFEYRTFCAVRIHVIAKILDFLVRYYDHSLNKKPFEDWVYFYHLNSRQVRYSGPYCNDIAKS